MAGVTRRPTAAQLRLIEAADRDTGRLRGGAAQLAALVRLGLAFRHPRPPHAYFLTPAGRRLRELAPGPAAPEPEVPGGGGVFAARPGGADGPAGGPERQRQVRSAWQGLMELRRMTRQDGATELPCGWERAHLREAAALALEAAGCSPAGADGDGYRVMESEQPEAVMVDAADSGALRACAAALTAAGWQPSEHTDRRTGRRYLLASPRRA